MNVPHPVLPLACILWVVTAAVTSAQTHTHGDMVGSVTQSTAVLWTRSSTGAQISVRYGTSSGLSGASQTAAVLSNGAMDFIAKFKLTGLQPGTRYYYSTRIANPSNPTQYVDGPISTFRTGPASTSAASVTMAFSGDIRTLADYDMFGKMLAHKPDVFLSLGDFPYADGATTIAEYWAKHKTTRNEARLWNFFRNLGVAAVWDDHEILNDWDANGMAAWKNYFPLLPEPQDIYHSFSWGPDLEVFMLDTRKYRGSNEAPDLPTKTLLGSKQKAWLKTALKASTSTFKLVCTSVPLRYGTTNLDFWGGYQRERREILEYARDERVGNVVFLSADQHWGAVHHLREGFREYQAGPLAIGNRTPLPLADPERRAIYLGRTYGIIRVDPSATPKTLTVELHDRAGLLHREVIRDEKPASIKVTGDVPEARFEMVGPVLFQNSGQEILLPRVEPGSYSFVFKAIPGLATAPSPIDLTLMPGGSLPGGSSSGGTLRVAARWYEVPPLNPVLLHLPFENMLSGFTVVDEGTKEGPSAWFTGNGYLIQSSNISGGSDLGSDPVKPGTMATTGLAAWKDYTMTVRLRSKDNDALGLVFRYKDQNNYYRFSFDSQRQYQRLTRKQNGVVSVLAQNSLGYTRHKWQKIRITAIGSKLTVYVDESKTFAVTDSAHATGKVGFYAWGNFVSEFDDLIVRAGEVLPPKNPGFPGALFQDNFNDGKFTGWTVLDQGTISAPSKWTEGNGVLKQLSNIYGGSGLGTVIPKPGSLALVSKALPNDYYFGVTMNNPDNDGMGVVFRYRDANNHYRFSWDAQRAYRRLAKVVNGNWTVISEDAVPYQVGRDYRIATQVEGKRIRILIDGKLWLDRTDASQPSGGIGLYTWGSLNLQFDDVLALPPQQDPSKDPTRTTSTPLPVLTAQLKGKTTDIVGRHLPSSGNLYALALAFSSRPGIPLSLVHPTDPRRLLLAPDALFFWSLTPTPVLSKFQGIVDSGGYLRATVNWPPLPGTSGSIIYCGGWIVDKATGKVAEVIPTVELVLP